MSKHAQIIVEGKLEEIVLDLEKATIKGPQTYDTDRAVTLMFVKSNQQLLIKDNRMLSRDSLKQGKQFYIDHFTVVPCLVSFERHKNENVIVLSDIRSSNGYERLILTDKKSHADNLKVAGNGVQAIHSATGIKLLCPKEPVSH